MVVANRGKRADSAEPSGVMGAYTNANSDTRLPTVTSKTRNPWAMSGRMPTTTKSLMPSTKLDAISVTAGSVKKRSLPCRPRMAEPDMTVPLLFFSSSRRNIH